MKPIKVIVLGAGSRGRIYAGYAESFPEKMEVVGVAEPREFHRNEMKETFNIPEERVVDDWKKIAEMEKFADAVIIATQDNMHHEPLIKFADMGYHILLEKPMAPTKQECLEMRDAVKRNNIMFSVCHVLRYTNYTKALVKLVRDGKVGKVISMQHLEPVGFWHQAHSFVRGNWRNSEESTFMFMAKSCHDLDWISYVMDEKCKSISSYGSLQYFNKDNQPKDATDRCLDCPADIENHCPYSAKKIYLGFLDQGVTGWPVNILHPQPTTESITQALREGPYGRCVFACDNDVVDHQVAAMEFESGSTCTFTMTAFNKAGQRKTQIFGTHGEINGDGRYIELFNFLTQETTKIDTLKDNGILQGHGGGDFGLMENFIDALLADDPNMIISGIDETIESHMMVFAGEKSRTEERSVKIENMF
jgi:predicted dehydrogenase